MLRCNSNNDPRKLPLFNTKKGGTKMEVSRADLVEAKRQIDSTLNKLRETVKTFESKEKPDQYKSQITLAKRRIQAFEISVFLIEREMNGLSE